MIDKPPALGSKLWVLTGQRSRPVEEVTVVGIAHGRTQDHSDMSVTPARPAPDASSLTVYYTNGQTVVSRNNHEPLFSIDRQRIYPTKAEALQQVIRQTTGSAHGYRTRLQEDEALVAELELLLEASVKEAQA